MSKVLLFLWFPVYAIAGGYVTDSEGGIIRSSDGLCWRTGYWTPAMAVLECDPELITKSPQYITPKPNPPKPAIKAPAIFEEQGVTTMSSAIEEPPRYSSATSSAVPQKRLMSPRTNKRHTITTKTTETIKTPMTTVVIETVDVIEELSEPAKKDDKTWLDYTSTIIGWLAALSTIALSWYKLQKPTTE